MPSIIQAIKDAILTETSSDVRIQERSFWSQLLEEKKNGSNTSPWSILWKVSLDKPFIATRFIFRCLYNILLGFIWLCNLLYELIFRGLTGRWRGFSRDESIKMGISNILKKGLAPAAGINLILIGLALVTGIVAIVYIVVFNVNNVVIIPNNLRTNKQGIISVDQAGLETQNFFLLNAASFWTPTGISLSEGDVVYITASGSMYGDILNMDTCARKNHKMDYHRSLIGPTHKESGKDTVNKLDTLNVHFCIYGRNTKLDKNARFGSLLYQVCSPIHIPKPYNLTGNCDKTVYQIDFDEENSAYRFTVQNPGTLYFCFNDILLDKATLQQIEKEYKQDTSNLNLKRLYKPLYETGWYSQQDKDSTIWFQDNLGEVLINVRVEHNLLHSALPWHKKLMTWCYRRVDHFFQWPWYWKSALILGLLITLSLGCFEPLIISKIRKNRKDIQ